MDKVKEAWARLTDSKQDSGIRGHEFIGGLAHHGAAHDPMTCPHCCDIRELVLAVHDEACEDFTVDHAVEHTDKHDCVMTQCGAGWDCPQALALKELGDGQG